MVGVGIADFCVRWFIANGPQSAVSGINASRRTEDVDIGLPPESRVQDIIGRLRKAFDNDVLHAGPAERFGGFPVGCLDALEAESIVPR